MITKPSPVGANLMANDNILARAEFDEKLKLYWYLQWIIAMVATVIGVLLVPVWLLGWGKWYTVRAFDALECVLTERSLIVRRGVFFRVEKTIPLDKVQDLSLREGPLLKALGLMSVRLETAGQSAAQNASEANLVGVVDARGFRDRVLVQRDLVTTNPTSSPVRVDSPENEQIQLLREIRDGIRALAKERAGDRKNQDT